MYRGFKLKLDAFTEKESESLYEAGSKLFAQQQKSVKASLRSLVLGDGSLDAAKLQNQWFPGVVADVFISHSHRDEKAAIVLAGYLYKHLGISSFIDSVVWGYGNDLLREIDTAYCSFEQDGKRFYNYEARNLSTSHVHLMVSSALTKMIDDTECIFFLDTPNSVKPKEIIESTLSPWIHSEILTTQLIRKRKPEQHTSRIRLVKSMSEGGQLGRVNESISMTYPIKTGHLTDIDANSIFFLTWRLRSINDEHKLDDLYRRYPITKQLLQG